MDEYADYEVEQEVQIVPIGGLAQFVSDSQRLFEGIIDSRTAKDAVKRIETVKKLMEAAGAVRRICESVLRAGGVAVLPNHGD